MPGNHNKNIKELCPGGEILKTTVVKDVESIKDMLADQKESFAGITKSIKILTEYSIRDKEKIDTLEKSRDCKSKKLNLLEEDIREIDKDFATHLGEHKAERRLTIASGVGSAGGLLGAWELFKYLVKGS